MNLSRAGLSPGKPSRFAFVCLVCCGFGASRALAIIDDGPDGSAPQAAEADVLPGGDQTAAPDLLLHGEATAKADALAAFSKAIIADDNADSDTALREYQRALALDPGYTELAVKVAFELARRGDPSAGVEVLKDNIKAAPNAPLAYLYLSQLYAKSLNKPEVGLKYAEQALDLAPANFTSYIAVYEICEAINQPQKAQDTLDRATTVQSTDPQFWLQLGEFYLKTIGTEPIPPAQVDKIGAVFAKGLALDPDNPQTLARVADFHLRVHQEKDAIPLYLKALKLSPANPPDAGQSLAAIRDSLARCLEAVGRDAEAISTLQQLVKDDPLRYEAYDLLCDLYDKVGNTDAALSTCQQMIVLDGTDFRNYVREAALLIKKGKMDAAIQVLNDARLKFPSEAQITRVLGLALSEDKRYQEATDIFGQALQEASQGETEMLDGDFYFAYGAAAEEAGQVDKATGLLRKAIELDPQSGEPYNYLGYMWVDRGMKLEEGAALIRKALALEPGNPAYIDSLGWYYFKKGQLKEAVATLRKAAHLIQPEDAVVDEHLGDAYAASNDVTRALNYWQRSANIDKENKEILVKIAGARQKLAKEGAPLPPTP